MLFDLVHDSNIRIHFLIKKKLLNFLGIKQGHKLLKVESLENLLPEVIQAMTEISKDHSSPYQKEALEFLEKHKEK